MDKAKEQAGKFASQAGVAFGKQWQNVREYANPKVSDFVTFVKNVAVSEPQDLIDAEKIGMTYITDRVIAMSFPSEQPAQLGKPIDQMSRFLNKRHPGKYMIWNLSEKQYDYNRFDQQIIEFKFPGYPSPPLNKIFEICASIDSWLTADEKNVAVVHCQTGKGRTLGTIACYLSWIGEISSPRKALLHAISARNTTLNNVVIPTQTRYLLYFSKILLKKQYPSPAPLKLDRIILNTIPTFESDRCQPYLQIFKNARLLYSTYQKDKQLKWYSPEDQSILFHVDMEIQGDILIRVRHLTSDLKRVSMLRFGFHTGYLEPGMTRLVKKELDGAWKDARFSEDFCVDMALSTPIENPEGKSECVKDTVYDWETVSKRKIRRPNKQPRFGIEEDVDDIFGKEDHSTETQPIDETLKSTLNQMTVSEAHEASKKAGEDKDFDELERYVQGLGDLEADAHEVDSDTEQLLAKLAEELDGPADQTSVDTDLGTLDEGLPYLETSRDTQMGIPHLEKEMQRLAAGKATSSGKPKETEQKHETQEDDKQQTQIETATSVDEMAGAVDNVFQIGNASDQSDEDDDAELP